MIKFDSKIERISELPPPPAERFFAWLDGFLTERKSLSESELEALKKQLKIYNSPRFIIEESK